MTRNTDTPWSPLDTALKAPECARGVSFDSAQEPPIREVHKLWIYFFCFTLCLASSSYSADFIILSNPKAYSILNKYEQQLSPEDKSRIVSGVPLQIVSEKQTLGDGITAAMKTTLLGDVYFLMLDDDGNTIGDAKGAYRKTYRNCSTHSDTIRIIRTGVITLSESAALTGKQAALAKGDDIIRVFTSGSLCYAARSGSPWRYGWCSLENRTAWSTVKTEVKVETGIKPAVRERIRSRIESANAIYTKYFQHFNTVTGQDKSPPQWQIKEGESEIIATLSGGYNYASQLRESSSRLATDLANALLGQPVEVREEGGEIRIRERRK